MVKEIRIYFEGDGALKPGLHQFLKEIRQAAYAQRCGFRLIEAKGAPVRDFRKALRANPDARNVLLLDSEEPMTDPVEHCRKKELDGHSDFVFWMVQCMESWFLADASSLRGYYGENFQESALHGNPQVEQIPKRDVQSRLKAATRKTSKGAYHKTRHAPDLLRLIEPELVKKAAPNCKRLFDSLL